MYRLMIVDDEALARYAFCTLISENFTNIQIVGEAESGRQAIELNRKLKPDIVIMDIKLPGFNGIDASQTIITEFPDTRILMLTAYDDFNYVQQALDIGVKGYLLKPLKEEEVVKKINKVQKDIDDSRSYLDLNKQIEEKISKVKPFIQKELITAFITGIGEKSEVESYINFLQERIEAGYFMLISLEQSYSQRINDSIRNKIHKNKVSDVVEKYLPLMKHCFFGNSIGNIFVVFFPVNGGYLRDSIKKESIMMAHNIKRKVKVITNFDIAIGIGNVQTDLLNLKQSYNEASIALRKAILQNDIIYYDDTFNNNEHLIQYPIKLESDFFEQLRMGNINKAKELSRDIIACIFNRNYNVTTIKEYISEFIAISKRVILQIGVDVSLVEETGILLELNMITEVDKLEIWIKNCVSTMIEYVAKLKGQKNNWVMDRVYEYINQQFYKDITLTMAAEQVGLSPQYFSKLFKEESGMNFIEYITNKRIFIAKELLQLGSKSIKEISKQVGYEDVNYFCRIFKKNTGLTPKQYSLKSKVMGDI